MPLVSPGAAAILVVVGVLLPMAITGAFNSDDESDAASSSGNPTASVITPASPMAAPDDTTATALRPWVGV
ncbi:hypothetical protein [Kitasatospora indigofera]|uniref:hypothetical protein n=1 Tax=Kitasatospora indigofera TaxID=67307 RepID=UPI0036971D51